MNLFDPKPRSALEFLPPQDDLDSLERHPGIVAVVIYTSMRRKLSLAKGILAPRYFWWANSPVIAKIMQGRPFVGPAGQLLDKCLESAGVDRAKVYVTNAVKHFKWEPRGKIRLHKKPNSLEITACRPWLEKEIAAVLPRIIVCLGATAAQALLGSQFRVTKHRGEVFPTPNGPVTATIHPSAILRMPEPEAREAETASLVNDLRVAAAYASKHGR